MGPQGLASPVSLRVLAAPGVVDTEPMLVFGDGNVEETVVVPQGARADALSSSLEEATASYAWPQGLREVKVSDLKL
jgi:hypothetical protein